jgi:hypothetical protein
LIIVGLTVRYLPVGRLIRGMSKKRGGFINSSLKTLANRREA